MEQVFEYLPLLFVAFGAVIVLVSVRGIVQGRRFVRGARRVPGVVTDVATTFTGRGEHLKASRRPVLTFTTEEGREVTAESWAESKLGIGRETDVLYDPEDPTKAAPAGDAGVGGGYGGIVVGLLAAAVGLAVFAGFPGHAGPFGGTENGCQIEHADGTSEPVDCPPGLDAE
ncbi:DUF3592 domain-containing protein [Nonomuraea sp. NPDC049684]|uniref:DUF3592 domain-containing protein n=1 Tax=Nonomuraea sp. NPDC049684 TaxID=3364356 RepID=UPI003789FE8A